MKKILIPIYSILIISFISLFVISHNKLIDYEFYTIKENHSFVYKEDRRMILNVYSKTKKPLIYYENENTYTVRLDGYTSRLKDIDITGIDYKDYFLIRIESEIPYVTDSEYHSDRFYLEIVNQKYTVSLDMGTISILNPKEIELVSIKSIKGIYEYNNGIYDLVGLNLKFNNNYEFLNDIRIGNYAYGLLKDSKINLEFMESIIDIKNYIPDYKYDNEIIKHNIGIKNETVFIPISYLEFNLIRKGYIIFTLDYVDYYFDVITFLSTTPDLNDYKERVVVGDLHA